MAGSFQVYWIELFLFYVLAMGTAFLPLRWGTICLILAGSVEVIPPGFVTASSVSWQNAAVRLILPTVLFLRLSRFRLPRIKWCFPAKAWAALVLYATISLIWSPFRLSGLKMVAYLAAWFILYLVFDLAWRRHVLCQGILITALWGSLALACLQTYILGNPLYGMVGRPEEFASAQFAPFTGPQSFGPFLACVLALLLFSRERRPLRAISIGACLIALVLVGSRYSVIEAGIVVLTWCLLQAKTFRIQGGVRFRRVLQILFMTVVSLLTFRVAMSWVLPESRLNQILELGSQPDIAESGTFGWRLLVYEDALTKLSERSIIGLVFGSGTSSGGEVATTGQIGRAEGVDPNRTIHDEFLRAEYEWGVIGLGLGFALIVWAFSRLWVRAFRLRSLGSYAALAIMPGILLALLIENPLADSGTAGCLGYALVLTYGFGVLPQHCSRPCTAAERWKRRIDVRSGSGRVKLETATGPLRPADPQI